jgi:hypothetical protein
MKARLKPVALLAIILAAPAWGQADTAREARVCRPEEMRGEPDPADPRRVFAAGGRISLVPPEGMRVLTRAELTQRSAAERAALFLTDSSTVVIADDQGAFITLGSSDLRLSRASVATLSFTFNTLDRRRGRFQPILDGQVVEFGHKRWVTFEYMVNVPPRGDIHHRRHFTDFQQGSASVQFIYPWSRAAGRAMKRSEASLKVHDCALLTAGENRGSGR